MTPIRVKRLKWQDCCCGFSTDVKLCPVQDRSLFAHRSEHNTARAGIGRKDLNAKQPSSNRDPEVKGGRSMYTNKKAALDAGTIESGMEKQKTGQAVSSPIRESITVTKRNQGRAGALLLCRKRRMEIKTALVFANMCHLRDEINHEQIHGALIQSTTCCRGGRFLPAQSSDEHIKIEVFFCTVNAHAVNSQRILRSALQALKVPEGQIKMGGDA